MRRKLALENKEIYKQESPLIKEFNDYVLALDPVKDFGLRGYMSSLTTSFLEFKPRPVFKGTWRKFKGFFKQVREIYDDLTDLESSCGELKGTYMDTNGNWVSFKKRFFGGVKGWNKDESLKFKGKNSDQMEWNLKYEFEENEYIANIKMQCQDIWIQLIIYLPHEEDSVWKLTKISTDTR